MTANSESDAEDELLQLVDVEKVYRQGDVPVPVLHDVQLQVRKGELLVIVGPSGSGKSTLLNLIGGIDRPTSGKVLFGGEDISDYNEGQLTEYRRRRIGFVFQFYNLVPTLTAIENVQVATEIANGALTPEEALRLVDLEHRIHHFPSQLSGGEQQRVAIARAVAKRPELLLCDEPTGALDLEMGRRILRVLLNLCQKLGTTVIIITHNIAIAGISDRLIRLGSGTIMQSERNEMRIPPEEVHW